MRTDFLIEAAPARPTVDFGPERLVARWSAAALGGFAFVALLPASVLPNGIPLLATLACVTAVLLSRGPMPMMRFDIVTPISVFVVAVGLFYVAASALELLDVGSLRPVRHDFIPRHSYYLFVWLPIMAGTTALFQSTWPDLLRVARHAALPTLATLAALDVGSAYLLGDPDRIQWEEYTAYLDPSALTFFYATCFFLYVASTRRVGLPLAIVTVHAAVSGWSDRGMMYNTMTGSFVLVCMWVFAMAVRRSPRIALYGVIALGGALVFGLIAGAAAPSLVGFDLNTQWRFLVWRENLFAALNSGLIGVGFGTPYYELSPGNIYEAHRLSKFSEFAQHALGSPMDILYVRGQHSSFVNAFYRMGILGGGALIAFNVAVLLVVARAVKKGAGDTQRAVAAAGAIFIVEASQVAMHVGIESPRYFTMYALAVGLARAAASLTRHERHV